MLIFLLLILLAVILFLLAIWGFNKMTVNLSALGGAGQQFFDNNGDPLTGGKLYSYEAGTTTPQVTYTTVAGNVPHSNPIILDAAGRVPSGEIWVTAGQNYKFVLKTSTEVTLATWDNITGINGTGIATNALYVQYDPAGAGAVATNVQTKLRESVSVKDFGAVGDGVVDDTAAFAAALLESGSVYIPNGTYIISELKLETGYELHGQSKTGVIIKGKADTVKIIKTNDAPTDYSNLPSYTTNITIENFTLDMSNMTDLDSRSGIYVAVSYFIVIRNIGYINESVFPLNAKQLNVDGFTYNLSCYDCFFPFVRCYGRPIIGGIYGFSTTCNFYTLNSYGIQMGYINASNFYSPVLQKEYDKFQFGPSASHINIIGGDIEQADEKFYLNGGGNYISNIVSFGNTFGGFEGGYKDNSTTWASCNFSDEFTTYGPRVLSALTRSGTVATGTTVQNHMLNSGDQCEIVGANDANFNGFKIVTVTGVKTFTYTVANTGPTDGFVAGSYVAPNWQGNGAAWYPLGNKFYRNVSGSRWETDSIYSSAITYAGINSTIGDSRVTAYGQGAAKVCYTTQTPSDVYFPMVMYNAAGSQIGSITASATNVAYNTSSDYRLKNITGSITESGKFIDSLKPYVGTWKADGSKFVGFLAHEVQEVSPTSAHGIKDTVDENGKPVYQSMEYGSAEFIANMVAELQALRKRVADLEAK
jgi:hypothetical protein